MALLTPTTTSGVTKFVNCRLVTPNGIETRDLYFNSCIIDGQEALFSNASIPDKVIDLQGRLVTPGFIDVQINGAFGFDFSVPQDHGPRYGEGLQKVNHKLIKTGVTSYLPTLTSQLPEVYQKALQFLGPSGDARNPWDGSESLGAHCEGPFLSPTKNGIHTREVLLTAPRGFDDIRECYGDLNLGHASKRDSGIGSPKAAIAMITAAPEVGKILSAVPDIVSHGIVYSIGHSEADYEIACKAVEAGATMITHLFNAMKPLHHRDPGIFGVLGRSEQHWRPYFGIIADGIHLHPSAVKIASTTHPDGFILVTDAMMLLGLPDGVYDWTNGEKITKRGPLLTLNDSDKIAGSAITLIECVSNYLTWSGASITDAVKAVTYTPAKMLGIENTKGSLAVGADADLLVLAEGFDPEKPRSLKIDQVWKFGTLVHDAQHE